MSKWKVSFASRLEAWDAKTHIPFIHGMFMRIAEPRVIRCMHFLVYICMMVAGVGIVFRPPEHLQSILGLTLLYVFAGFVTIGALFAAIAVLPGIWWLERVGIIMLTTSMAMYVVVIVALGSSPVAVSVALALTITFAQRWTEIRGAQLAPREV
jgi:hypothetical protein